jgi:hypothetical protein
LSPSTTASLSAPSLLLNRHPSLFCELPRYPCLTLESARHFLGESARLVTEARRTQSGDAAAAAGQVMACALHGRRSLLRGTPAPLVLCANTPCSPPPPPRAMGGDAGGDACTRGGRMRWERRASCGWGLWACRPRC